MACVWRTDIGLIRKMLSVRWAIRASWKIILKGYSWKNRTDIWNLNGLGGCFCLCKVPESLFKIENDGLGVPWMNEWHFLILYEERLSLYISHNIGTSLWRCQQFWKLNLCTHTVELSLGRMNQVGHSNLLFSLSLKRMNQVGFDSLSKAVS